MAMAIAEDIVNRGARRLLQESHRVLGVGVGVFLLGFFGIVCVMLALLGSRTTKPGLAYTASVGVYVIILVVLLASPKGLPPPHSPVGYDQTAIPLAVTMVLVSLGVVASLAGLVLFHLSAAVYARPLNYHTDVLNQQ
eukprot:GHRR01017277.1.p1 GENE.GHRR01017277.1~~GHRR01017277.1.p1  ORF type:complete len:138 (+),score=31.59 GHRR01017277.1:517-930(+)